MWNFLGPGLVMLFAVSQAFRDVYFANVFQGIDFFFIVLLAFSITTLLFGIVTLVREPETLRKIVGEVTAFAWMNLTTAIAWTSYFFALTHLQPSIVNTIHSGIGPLTVIVLAGLGMHIVRPSPVGRVEYVCYAGLALSLAFLAALVFTGHSGLPAADLGVSITALALLVVSGSSITISLLISRRLNERGIGANAISAGRYLVIVAIALLATTLGGRYPNSIAATELASLALLTTALIVLPLYTLQVGISRTAPLTAHIIRSLGPVCVFALELIDSRITYSTLTLAGIVLYSVFAIGTNLARGWKEEPAGA